jgi:hypothetical protein
MNPLIGMIADFVENLSNPALGREVNESYSLRLGTLLDGNGAFSEQLANADLGAEDISSMPVSSWLWYLNWRQVNAGRIPGESFLDALYESTGEPIVRLRIIEFAVARSRGDSDKISAEPSSAITVSELPRSWLRHRMESIVGQDRRSGQSLESRTGEAWEIAALLLQLGDETSLRTLRALLAERWEGRTLLIGLAERFISQTGLDPEEISRLRRRLGLPSPEEQ